MKRFANVSISAVLLALFLAPAAQAQSKGHIELKSAAEIETETVNDRGEKEFRRVPAGKVLPGDEVVFTTFYGNIGQEAAENVVITNPVPEHMVYLGGSAAGEGTVITFSIDGGSAYDLPEKLKVTGDDGSERLALPSEYTHILWAFERDLRPGEKGEVSFRAVVK